MKIKTTMLWGTLLSVLQVLSAPVYAKNTDVNPDKSSQVYQLSYIEREPGADEYEITMLVSERYIRVDEVGENSGYIVYDDKDRVIYSVSHQDKSVLLIKEFKFTKADAPVKSSVEYLQLADAPSVSGKEIYNYRVYINEGKDEETCTEIQLVEGLLPEVRKILHNYQIVISGQQVKMTDNKISDMQPACYFVDQIYNTGAYYEKGLPIQEWHSNERSKILTTYKKVSIDFSKFKVPEDYRRFSVDPGSKTFIK